MKEEKFWVLLSKKITGEATGEELDLLNQLVSENASWQNIMENLQELWNSKPQHVLSHNARQTEDAYLVHINRLKGKAPDFKESGLPDYGFHPNKSVKQKRPLYKNRLVYATAAVVAGMLFFFTPVFKTGVQNNPTESLKTPDNEITINPGSRSKIQLPDGSQVWINSGSKLTYNNMFAGTTREVRLDGEAYFDVVKDASHPFIVHTSGIDIKVLGTAFNVKAYKAESFIEATLIHGSIEVINKNRPDAPTVMLKPHEKLIYNKLLATDSRDQRADVSLPVESDSYSITIKPLSKNIADSDIVETAWVYNKFTFEDERFEDLARKMERWYNIRISIANDKLKDHRVSGSFLNETAEEAIKELQFLIPFRYSVKNNEIFIVKK